VAQDGADLVRCRNVHADFELALLPLLCVPLLAYKATRFIEIPLQRRSGVPFTEEELTRMRGGRTAEEYRWHLIRTYLKDK
jgi:hypothetical protein